MVCDWSLLVSCVLHAEKIAKRTRHLFVNSRDHSTNYSTSAWTSLENLGIPAPVVWTNDNLFASGHGLEFYSLVGSKTRRLIFALDLTAKDCLHCMLVPPTPIPAPRDGAQLAVGLKGRWSVMAHICASLQTGRTILTFFFSITTTAALSSSNTPVHVQTTKGLVEGYVSEDAAVFEGIPYAMPPVGNLRFQVHNRER